MLPHRTNDSSRKVGVTEPGERDGNHSSVRIVLVPVNTAGGISALSRTHLRTCRHTCPITGPGVLYGDIFVEVSTTHTLAKQINKWIVAANHSRKAQVLSK